MPHPIFRIKAFPGVLAEGLSKAKPAEWIYILFTYGKTYEYIWAGNVDSVEMEWTRRYSIFSMGNELQKSSWMQPRQTTWSCYGIYSQAPRQTLRIR